MARTSKNHRTEIGENGSHVIRNEAVSLTEKEFRVRAIRYISLLYKVFCKWQGAAESTGSPSTSVWETMSEWKREQTIKEFFVLYLQ